MAKHDITKIEGTGFTAKIHQSDDAWHAQVRVQDDEGARGRVLNFVAADPSALADRLEELAANLVSAGNAVRNAATTEPDEVQPAPEPEPAPPAWPQ